jgi:hypothetical protein
MRVGPFSAEVLDPFRTLRFDLADNESGLSFGLEWIGSFEPYLEDRHIETSGVRITHDLSRYVQVGRGQGWISLGGERIEVRPETWWGERDHSWGLRPLPRSPGGAPTGRPEWSFLLFMPLQFDEFGVHVYLFEDAEGRPTHLSCGVMERSPNATRPHVALLTHDLRWEAGAATPTVVGGTIDIELTDGRRLPIELEARPGRAHLRGGGYGGVDGWFQGQWREGDTAVAEVWDLTDSQRARAWGASSSDHAMRASCDGVEGFGITEYMVLPDHRRYGFVRG